MSNSYVVQVLCFAWAVTLAEVCRIGDLNTKCQIGSMACEITVLYYGADLPRVDWRTLEIRNVLESKQFRVYRRQGQCVRMNNAFGRRNLSIGCQVDERLSKKA